MPSGIALAAGLIFALHGASAASLENLLAEMDQASASFRGVEARLVKLTHTAVLNDTSQESGAVLMRRVKPGQVRARIEFREPEARSVAFSGRKAEIYYPKIQTVQIYDLGKHSQLVDQFLLLGFGSSGRELARNYTLKVTGEEVIHNEQTTGLELIPKSSQVLEHLKKVELWISAAGAYPVRQKFYQPGGDYTLITYSEVKLNPVLNEGDLELKLSQNVKREYPQK